MIILGNSQCNCSDLCTDIDAYKIVQYIIGNLPILDHPLSEAMKWYYTNYANIRFNFYPDEIGCDKALGDLETKISSKMHGAFETMTTPAGLLKQKAGDSTPEMQLACCKSLANFILKELIIF